MFSKPHSTVLLSKHKNGRYRTASLPEVSPVALAKYTFDDGLDANDADVAEQVWASKLVKTGANLATSRRPAPFLKTAPSAMLDKVIEDMLANAILVRDRHINAAYPMTVTIRDLEDVSYQAVQDFSSLSNTESHYKDSIFQESFLPLQRIAPIDEMIRINLRLGFYQLQLDSASRLSCGVWYAGQFFAMTRLPPRHPEAPLVMQRWANAVGRLLEVKFGVCCVFLLDEWLIHAPKLPVDEILIHLKNVLGVQVDFRKSVLVPCKRLAFRDFILNCHEQSVQLTREGISFLENNVRHIEHLNWIERERLARYWMWISHCHRLPLFISDQLVSGTATVIEQFLKNYPFRAPKLIKRSQRTIDIFVYARENKIVALSPEFQVAYKRRVSSSTPLMALQAEAAIRSATWGVDALAPDRVDVGIYLSSSVSGCYRLLSRGRGRLLQENAYLIELLVLLYTKVRSRTITWHPEKCYRESAIRPPKETVDSHFRESF